MRVRVVAEESCDALWALRDGAGLWLRCDPLLSSSRWLHAGEKQMLSGKNSQRGGSVIFTWGRKTASVWELMPRSFPWPAKMCRRPSL